ncbi:MAG: DNA polymerase subunit beta [Parcubacteria group bacterium Gr01-1014_33]|nr:MAG: DNA polymerase subunit beta [Parcubacteria group bacterium Gr01-1014_33]
MERIIVEQKIREVADKIVAEFQPEKIILFGSWAWGKPHEDSDVDLLVVKDSTRPRIERERELYALLPRRDIAMDVLVYTRRELEDKINRDRNLFLEDIVHNGTVLYSQSEDEIRLTHEPAELVAKKI